MDEKALCVARSHCWYRPETQLADLDASPISQPSSSEALRRSGLRRCQQSKCHGNVLQKTLSRETAVSLAQSGAGWAKSYGARLPIPNLPVSLPRSTQHKLDTQRNRIHPVERCLSRWWLLMRPPLVHSSLLTDSVHLFVCSDTIHSHPTSTFTKNSYA